jgi:NAD+ kinase
MSAGGPILTPTCNNIIISPIASHNLSVRPIVVPDNYIMKLKIESRSASFLTTIDSRTFELPTGSEITLKPSPFKINMIRLNNNSFYNNMRNKLMWGLDFRN